MKVTYHRNGLLITGKIDFAKLIQVAENANTDYTVESLDRVTWFGLFGMAPIVKADLEA